MHGATIQVKSIEGKGSTFTVTFRKGYRHFGNEADLIKKELTTETTDKGTKNIQENIGYTDKQEIRCKNLPENQLYWSLRITPTCKNFFAPS